MPGDLEARIMPRALLNYYQLFKAIPYYHPVTEEQAFDLLENQPAGTYLLRSMNSSEYDLVGFSVRIDGGDFKVLHGRTVAARHPGLYHHFHSVKFETFHEDHQTNNCTLSKYLKYPLHRSYPLPLSQICRAKVSSMVKNEDQIKHCFLNQNVEQFMTEGASYYGLNIEPWGMVCQEYDILHMHSLSDDGHKIAHFDNYTLGTHSSNCDKCE